MSVHRESLKDAQTFDLYVNLWIAAVKEGTVVASEPSLVRFLGLADRKELAEVEEARQDLQDSIKRARNLLEEYWFEQLRRPSREVNVAGPIFALKAQAGYRDTDKGNAQPVTVNVYGPHAKNL